MAKIIASLIEAIRAFNVSECVMDWNGKIDPLSCITEDLNVWAGREVLTVDGLEEWLNCKLGFSDYHKDVHGCRPRWDFSEYTLSEWRKTYEILKADSIIEQEREAELGREAVYNFKKLIAKTAAMGAGDFKTAMRWLMQADDIDRRSKQDIECFFYGHGILFTEYGKKLMRLAY